MAVASSRAATRGGVRVCFLSGQAILVRSSQVLRMVRLVRPLRTLNRFPSVRVIVDALARSMRGLANVLLILFLYVVLFCVCVSCALQPL